VCGVHLLKEATFHVSAGKHILRALPSGKHASAKSFGFEEDKVL
jgi:hypothetical protein